jgi:hypothetical protein
MLNGLREVSLKRVVTKDSSTVQVSVGQEKELNRRLQEADVDFWYDSIKDVTYETTFVSVSPEEARAMAAHYKARTEGGEVDDGVTQTLANLKTRVEEALEPFREDGVFVKLDSRSPKDATNRFEAGKKILKEMLNNRDPNTFTPDELVNFVFQAHIASFRLFTAIEVIETLLYSNRVVTDEIPLALDHLDTWKVQIVLRRWCDLPVRFEFRGFVFDNKLTALCQYYNEVVCPDVIVNKEKIQHLIQNFFEQVRDRIPITPKEYVIDFLVDLENDKVLIVEINPFGKPDGLGTGCVHFDPSCSLDAAVLFGEAEFEFRLDTNPLSRTDFEKMRAEAQRSTANHWARSKLLLEL